MRILKRRTVQETAERWRSQYFRPSGRHGDGPPAWGSTVLGPAEDTHRQILACATPDEVDAVVSGWTTHWCIHCKDYKSPAVSLSDDDYGQIVVCADCVAAAMGGFDAL